MIFFEDEEVKEICQINPNCKLEEIIYDNTKFKVIKNFLLFPEKYIKLLETFPAATDHTYSPGYRQDIPPWAVKFITGYIQKNIMNWKPSKVCCNIYSGNMRMKENSNLPHSDPFHFVWNLWLSKNCLGGTAFWKNKNKSHVNDLSKEEYHLLFDKVLSSNKYQQWKNFKGNEDWEMICIAPMEFNTLLFYNGGFFHSPWIEENWYLDEYRYSMVGMGDFDD